MTELLVKIDANENGKFKFSDMKGDDSYYLSVSHGHKVGWICFRGGGQVGYEIVFPKKSPFRGRSRISVPAGGHSGFFSVDDGKLGDDLKYTVLIPSLDWRHDPDVLIDAVEFSADFTIVERQEVTMERDCEKVAFCPDCAPDVTGKRVNWSSNNAPYTVVFKSSPFVGGSLDVEGRDDGKSEALLVDKKASGPYPYKVKFQDGLTVDGPGLTAKYKSGKSDRG